VSQPAEVSGECADGRLKSALRSTLEVCLVTGL
jgi:hypothetical protein